MSGEEFVLAIVGIVMVSCVLIVGITKISGLIKAWINRNSNSAGDEAFDRLAKAFMQHKKEMQERVQNLEAIIADEEKDAGFSQIEAPKNEGNLTNNLQQKNKGRS